MTWLQILLVTCTKTNSRLSFLPGQIKFCSTSLHAAYILLQKLLSKLRTQCDTHEPHEFEFLFNEWYVYTIITYKNLKALLSNTMEIQGYWYPLLNYDERRQHSDRCMLKEKVVSYMLDTNITSPVFSLIILRLHQYVFNWRIHPSLTEVDKIYYRNPL